MAVHVAHPSVRVRGMEAEFTPLYCSDSKCSLVAKGSHQHCPFCPMQVCFTDEEMLKAHYRVKHVDKAVQFAGLKILRCCAACEVHGIILEKKHFKVPHFHCYHCKNGFNRKEEALKHYKQHFRHPETTIQIVLSQDVNQSLTKSMVPKTTTVIAGPFAVPMIASDSPSDPVVVVEVPGKDGKRTLRSRSMGGLSALRKDQLRKTILQERAKWAQTESKMKASIERLRTKVEYLTNTNTSLKQQLAQMQSSSLKRLTNDSDHGPILTGLVRQMSEDHSRLLHHHLAQLRLFVEACHFPHADRDEPKSKDGQSTPSDRRSESPSDLQEITRAVSPDSVFDEMEGTASKDAPKGVKRKQGKAATGTRATKDGQRSSSNNNVSHRNTNNVSRENPSDSGQEYQYDPEDHEDHMYHRKMPVKGRPKNLLKRPRTAKKTGKAKKLKKN